MPWSLSQTKDLLRKEHFLSPVLLNRCHPVDALHPQFQARDWWETWLQILKKLLEFWIKSADLGFIYLFFWVGFYSAIKSVLTWMNTLSSVKLRSSTYKMRELYYFQFCKSWISKLRCTNIFFIKCHWIYNKKLRC